MIAFHEKTRLFAQAGCDDHEGIKSQRVAYQLYSRPKYPPCNK